MNLFKTAKCLLIGTGINALPERRAGPATEQSVWEYLTHSREAAPGQKGGEAVVPLPHPVLPWCPLSPDRQMEFHSPECNYYVVKFGNGVSETQEAKEERRQSQDARKRK